MTPNSRAAAAVGVDFRFPVAAAAAAVDAGGRRRGRRWPSASYLDLEGPCVSERCALAELDASENSKRTSVV